MQNDRRRLLLYYGILPWETNRKKKAPENKTRQDGNGARSKRPRATAKSVGRGRASSTVAAKRRNARGRVKAKHPQSASTSSSDSEAGTDITESDPSDDTDATDSETGFRDPGPRTVRAKPQHRKRKRAASERNTGPVKRKPRPRQANRSEPQLSVSPGPEIRRTRKRRGAGPHMCHICRVMFVRRSCVRRHMMSKHAGEMPYECPSCGRRFAQKISLTRHQSTHTREESHECSQCGAKFGAQRNLRRHQRAHTEARPHKCHLCTAAFARKDTLKCHIRIHTGERPYQCDACGAKFSDKAALRHHRLIHDRQAHATSSHPGSHGTSAGSSGDECREEHPEKRYPYHCRPCGRNFVNRETLERHEQQHAGGNVYTCSYCPATFRHKSHLDRHNVQHSGGKPFECSMCGSRFTRAWCLSRHLRKVECTKPTTAMGEEKVTGGEPSQCNSQTPPPDEDDVEPGFSSCDYLVTGNDSPSSGESSTQSEGVQDAASGLGSVHSEPTDAPPPDEDDVEPGFNSCDYLVTGNDSPSGGESSTQSEGVQDAASGLGSVHSEPTDASLRKAPAQDSLCDHQTPAPPDDDRNAAVEENDANGVFFGNLAAKGCPNGSDMSSLSKSNPTIDPELGPFCCETSVKKVDVDASPSVQ